MQNLPKSGGAVASLTALGANQSSQEFSVCGSYFQFAAFGTWDGATLSLMVQHEPNGSFIPFAVMDNGVRTEQQFTDDVHHGYLVNGLRFRFDMENTGSPDVNVQLTGNIIFHKDT